MIGTIKPSATAGGQPIVNAGDDTTPLGSSAATTSVDYNGLRSTSNNDTGLNLGGHVTGAVNQDINDPLSTKRGAISSNPQSNPPATNIANATFTYPILFASTSGSWIHGVSSNIEGVDRESPQSLPAASNPQISQTVSWAFTFPGNPLLYNSFGHTNLFDIQGPGGLGGVAVFSNAYYPALDPFATAYRNAASNTSLNVTPNFIADEPNTTVPTPTGMGGSAVLDDIGQARPDFKVRPLVLAQNAVAASGAPATMADTDTGQTGFPLDLNGHFFDKEFAGAGGAATGATQFPPISAVNGFGYSNTANYNNDGQHPLGDYHVWLRLPGYSNVGTRLANGSVNGGLAYTDVNNQIPDGVRGSTSPRTWAGGYGCAITG